MLPGVGASVAGTKLALAWIIAGSQLGAPAPPAAAPVASGSADNGVAADPGDRAALAAEDETSPPRVAGAYVGGMLALSLTVPRLDSVDSGPSTVATAGSAESTPIGGFTMSVDAGTVVLPWMSIGFSLLGGGGSRDVGRGRRLSHGGLLADIAFFPKPTLPLSLRAGFGAGFGSVREAEKNPETGAAPKSASFGGAMFRLGARYAFFPNAKKRRPRRAGGWALAPEIAWLAHPPSERGGAMANTIILGLWSGFFFGN